MGSGFTGAQQRARLMGRSSTPPSTTGERAALRAPVLRLGAGGVAAGAGTGTGASRAASSSNFRNQARTLERLRGLTRKPEVSDNQSRLGAGNLCVSISTT